MSTLDFSALVSRHRNYFRSGTTRPVEWREGQLTALWAMMTDHAEDFYAALWSDLRRNRTDADLTEPDPRPRCLADAGSSTARRVRRHRQRAGAGLPRLLARVREVVSDVRAHSSLRRQIDTLRVTGTASRANLDFVRGLGADEVIDYQATRFEDVVRDIDVVFDTVGGETLERSWDVLKPGGRLVTISASGERTADERTRSAFFMVEPSGSQLEEIAWLIDSGAIRPIVGSVFPLAEARQAYQHKPAHGKTVLQVVAAG